MDSGTLKSHYSVPSPSIDSCVAMVPRPRVCVFVFVPQLGLALRSVIALSANAHAFFEVTRNQATRLSARNLLFNIRFQ